MDNQKIASQYNYKYVKYALFSVAMRWGKQNFLLVGKMSGDLACVTDSAWSPERFRKRWLPVKVNKMKLTQCMPKSGKKWNDYQ